MCELPQADDLPPWFRYPEPFLDLVSHGVVILTPWHLLEREECLQRLQGLSQRYPQRHLVPFAIRQDNDDVACFDRDLPHGVVIIHDWASPGYELRETFGSFAGWFGRACDDMMEFLLLIE